jgi:hypothetical protein
MADKKSNLTIAAEIATIVACLLCAVGVVFAGMALRNAKPLPVVPAPTSGRTIETRDTGMVLTPIESWLFGGAIGSSVAGSILFFVASRRRGIGRPQPQASPSKLAIISASYGVKGGPDEDVAEKYLRPRISGDALAGWVGADLFGALDPAIGKYKRLKVRYSYEGNEATIERGENELLVLPEDHRLKAAQMPSAAQATERALGLVGDLGGFLTRLGKEKPDAALAPVLFDRPDDPAIRDSFPSEFASRVIGMKDLFGNFGVLDIEVGMGSTLGNPSVKNAENVREIIKCLRSGAVAIEQRYITGRTIQLAAHPQAHAMDAPTSIEFRDSWDKTQYIRARELGLLASELFSTIQIDIFSLRKDLLDFVNSRPRPEKDTFDGTPSEQTSKFLTVVHQHDQQLASHYALDFTNRATTLCHRLNIMNLGNERLKYLSEHSRSRENICELIDMLWTEAARVGGAKT